MARRSSPPGARPRSPNTRPPAHRPSGTRPSGHGTRTNAPGSPRPGSGRSSADARSSVSRPRATRSNNTFGPPWLATQLATLVPGYPNTSLCVALSGGVDSTALLAALAAIHPRPGAIRALHVDHGLRPASRRWAQHCRTLARRLRVPLRVLTTQVTRPPGASLEAAARDARYDVLAAALKPGEALLLAHHADDQLETVLLQLFRGSGLPGLSAMPATAPFVQGILVRPLLSRSRDELEAWVRGQGITWIEDDSNADESLGRNYLRRRILPLVRERWPGSATAVARSARHVAEAQALLDKVALADLGRASYGESLSAKALRALPPDRLNNALRFWIARAGFRVPDTRRLAEISGPLLNAREDAHPFVEWGEEGARVQRQGELLTLTRRDAPHARRTTTPADSRSAPADPRLTTADSPRIGTDLPSSAADSQPARTDLPAEPSAPSARRSTAADSPRAGTDLPSSAAELPGLVWSWRDSPDCALPHGLGKLQLEPDARGPIDLDALPHPLTVRWRRGGERLAPRRGGPRRALKSLLQESHVPASERPRLPLLFSTTTAPATTTPSASTAPRDSAASAHSTTSSASIATGGCATRAEKLLAVADLLLDETVQATSATRRRARLRWVKSSH